MRTHLAIAVVCMLFMHCEEDQESLHTDDYDTGCSTPATIRDRTASGCYYLFELKDGTLLSSLVVGFCGTPPIPDGIPNNPLITIKLEEGKKVFLDYTAPPEGTPQPACADRTVVITCIKEASPVTEDR